jgi:hypothetical protein
MNPRRSAAIVNMKRKNAAGRKQRERRQRAVAKAQSAFEAAEREHAKKVGAIEAEAAALEKRAKAEDARWEKKRADSIEP